MKNHDLARSFEEAVKQRSKGKYVLKLYVTGNTPKSIAAITNIRRICEQQLRNRYQLEVIDLYQQPRLAAGEQIVAAPTLIKKLPLPVRRLVGSLSDDENILIGLDLKPRPA